MNRGQRRKALKLHKQHMKASEADIPNRYYVSYRVEDLPVPHVPSETDQCDLCKEDVWIDKKFMATRKRSKGLHCSRCAEELSGRPFEAMMTDQINGDLGTEI